MIRKKRRNIDIRPSAIFGIIFWSLFTILMNPAEMAIVQTNNMRMVLRCFPLIRKSFLIICIVSSFLSVLLAVFLAEFDRLMVCSILIGSASVSIVIICGVSVFIL